MTGLLGFWERSDAISRSVAAVLLLMSVTAWLLIFWKGWLLRRARRDIARAVPAFWAAPSLQAGCVALARLDREGVLGTLVAAATRDTAHGTLEADTSFAARLTRRLRDALQTVLVPLRFGQVALASIGSTAPFIGLFGTVWGIYHALLGLSDGGAMTIEKVAGPVGEALVMTAAGLAVAIPAVIAYNVFGHRVDDCEAELEGFAHDLREMLAEAPALADTPPASSTHTAMVGT